MERSVYSSYRSTLLKINWMYVYSSRRRVGGIRDFSPGDPGSNPGGSIGFFRFAFLMSGVHSCLVRENQ